MQFTFLGTSAGTPTRARNVTGLALEASDGKGWYLVDCGEATQHQILRTRHTLARLRAIFLTHVHGDHTFGLPGLLASASMAGRTEPLSIIGPRPIQHFVQTALAATDSTLNYALNFAEVEPEDFSWADDAVQVHRVSLSHRVPCFAYVFSEARLERTLLTDKLRDQGIAAGPAWGRIQRGEDVELEDGRTLRSRDYVAINRAPRCIIVAGDNDRPELLAEACQEAQVLIHEATYTQEVADRVGPAPQHSSAARVATFAQSVKLPHLVLTHFSSRYQFEHKSAPLISDIAEEAQRYYSGGLHLAKDFAEYQLKKDLTLAELSQ